LAARVVKRDGVGAGIGIGQRQRFAQAPAQEAAPAGTLGLFRKNEGV